MEYKRSLIDNVEYNIKLIPETQEEIDSFNKYWKKGATVNIFIGDDDALIIQTLKPL